MFTSNVCSPVPVCICMYYMIISTATVTYFKLLKTYSDLCHIIIYNMFFSLPYVM